MLNAQGEKIRCKGAYAIVDGGMTKRACFVDPMHERVTYDAVHWSEWAESISEGRGVHIRYSEATIPNFKIGCVEP